MDGQLGAVPEIGAGGPGKNSLYLNALVLDLVMERLSEIYHECFCAAVDTVEQFRTEGGNGSNVNDEPLRARQKAGESRGGNACQRGDVQLDHVVHVVDVRIDQLGN